MAMSWKERDLDALNKTAIDGARALVEEVNKISPFSEASSIHDIGSGNGAVIGELLAEHGSDMPNSAKLLASDTSPVMLAQLKDRQQQEVGSGNSVWERVAIRAIDAGAMTDIADGSTSHIVAGNVLYAVPDYKAVLSEVLRTLEPDGVFGFSVNAVAPWVTLMGLVSAVRPDRSAPYPPAMWHSVESCSGLLAEAGFRDVQGTMKDIDLLYDSYDSVVEYLVDVMPFMPRLMSGMTDDEVRKMKELMVEDLKRQSPALPGKMAGKSVIVTGRK
jgi:SAM-dependent methyltransferase